MAIVKITPISAKKNEAGDAFTTASMGTAVDASAGAYFEMSKADAKYVVVLGNADSSTAKTATIKAGNGLQGVADYEVSIAALKSVAIHLESGAFKNVSGDNNGRVVIKGTDANVTVAVFEIV